MKTRVITEAYECAHFLSFGSFMMLSSNDANMRIFSQCRGKNFEKRTLSGKIIFGYFLELQTYYMLLNWYMEVSYFITNVMTNINS